MKKNILINSDKHIAFTSIQEVKAICQPFLDAFNLSMFDYVRSYDDGSYISLNSDEAYTHYFYQQGYHNTVLVGKNDTNLIKDKQSAYFLSSVYPGISHPLTVDLKKYFDCNQLFIFLKREKDYYEYFSVAASEKVYGITEFYLKNVGALIKFFDYFAEKSETIINEADKQRIFFPKHLIDIPKSHISNDSKLRNRSIRMINQEQKFKMWQHNHYIKYSITERESECLHFMILGKSASEIADELGISRRTVETHIKVIKDKFNCYKKSELIENAILTYIPNW